MSKKWFAGPPPSLGWWPASYSRTDDVYRWWDGEVWSSGCSSGRSKNAASDGARFKELRAISLTVEWQHRPKSWPKRSMT